jgi:hypothetical protein
MLCDRCHCHKPKYCKYNHCSCSKLFKKCQCQKKCKKSPN